MSSSHHFLFAALVISPSRTRIRQRDLSSVGEAAVSQSHHVLSSEFILMPSGRRRVATLVKTKQNASVRPWSLTLHGCLEGRKPSLLCFTFTQEPFSVVRSETSYLINNHSACICIFIHLKKCTVTCSRCSSFVVSRWERLRLL